MSYKKGAFSFLWRNLINLADADVSWHVKRGGTGSTREQGGVEGGVQEGCRREGKMLSGRVRGFVWSPQTRWDEERLGMLLRPPSFSFQLSG